MRVPPRLGMFPHAGARCCCCVLVVPARVHRRERGVRALPNLAHGVLVALASRRHASNLAQREVRIRALALSDASTGVRERAAVSHADVVTVVVHLELDVVVVVVVARRRRGGGRRVSFFSSRFLFSASSLRAPFAPRPGDRPRLLLRAAGARRPREEAGDGHVVVGLRSGAVRSFSRARSRRLVRRRPNPSRPMNALRSTPSPAGRARRANYRASGPAAPWRARRRGRLAARACGRSGPPCGTPAGETQSRGGDSRSRILRDLEASRRRPPRPNHARRRRIFRDRPPSRTRLPRRTRRRRPSAPAWAQSPSNF